MMELLRGTLERIFILRDKERDIGRPYVYHLVQLTL